MKPIEPSPVQELSSLLSDPRTKRELYKVQRAILRDAARDEADAVDDNEHADLEGYIDRERCGVRREFRVRRGEYEHILRNQIIDKLSRPRSITLRDLSRLFFEHMLVRDVEFDDAFNRFRSAARGVAEDVQRTAPFPIARLSRGPVQPLDASTLAALSKGEIPDNCLREMHRTDEQRHLDMIPPGTALWGPTLLFGPVLKVVGCFPSAYSWEREPHDKSNEMLVFAGLEGEMSPSAAKCLAAEIKPVVRSICRTYALLYLRPSIMPARRQLRRLEQEDVGLWRCFLRDCLDAYYTANPRKDALAMRLRNAIHLLVEADRQKRRGIGAALCMTALEALLGETGQDISNRLAQNTAALLEPDKTVRAQARNVVKKLYNLRCRVLHGEPIEVDVHKLRGSRLLCAAALKAVIDWSRHDRSFGAADETANTLFKDLIRASDHGDRVDGVGDLPSVRQLWSRAAADQISS